MFPIVILLCVFLTLILAIREIVKNFRRKPVLFWLHHIILDFFHFEFISLKICFLACN